MHDVINKGGRGVPSVVNQDELKAIRGQFWVQVTIKADLIEGEIDFPDIIL